MIVSAQLGDSRHVQTALGIQHAYFTPGPRARLRISWWSPGFDACPPALSRSVYYNLRFPHPACSPFPSPFTLDPTRPYHEAAFGMSSYDMMFLNRCLSINFGACAGFNQCARGLQYV